jgi:hypothetical protein
MTGSEESRISEPGTYVVNENYGQRVPSICRCDDHFSEEMRKADARASHSVAARRHLPKAASKKPYKA